MISWETFVWPLLGILASALAGLGYAAWRDFGARRSVAAVAAGRRVAVPMTVDAGGVVRGHGVRDGMDIRVLAKKHHLVVDREEFGTSTTRRGRFDDELFEYAELVGLVDDSGRRYYVGPPEEWAPAFQATLEAPARPAGGLWRLWAGTSRIALGVLTAASDDDDGVTFGDDVESARVHVRAGLRVVMLSRSSSCRRGLAGMAAPPLCALSRCVPVREAGRGRSLR